MTLLIMFCDKFYINIFFCVLLLPSTPGFWRKGENFQRLFGSANVSTCAATERFKTFRAGNEAFFFQLRTLWNNLFLFFPFFSSFHYSWIKIKSDWNRLRRTICKECVKTLISFEWKQCQLHLWEQVSAILQRCFEFSEPLVNNNGSVKKNLRKDTPYDVRKNLDFLSPPPSVTKFAPKIKKNCIGCHKVQTPRPP